MPIYLFWSESDREVFGFTFESDGGNLPTDLAPWSKNGEGEALPDENLASNSVVRAVQRDGFYLARLLRAPLAGPPHSLI
jgi:hypothetical protein